nr:ester cyclase [Chloroflexota bacterium]
MTTEARMQDSNVERTTAVVRRFFEEGWNRRDFAVFGEVHAPDHVFHSQPGSASSRPGTDGCKEAVARILESIPDYHVTLEKVLAADDRVIVRYTVWGTHAGTFLGVAPTGRTFVYEGMEIPRLAD